MRKSELYGDILESGSADRDLDTSAEDVYTDSVNDDQLTDPEVLNEAYLSFVEDVGEGGVDDKDSYASRLLRREHYGQAHVNCFFSSLNTLEEKAREIAGEKVTGQPQYFDPRFMTNPFINGIIDQYDGEELTLPDLDDYNLSSNHGKGITVQGDIHAGPYGVESGEIIIEGNAADEFAFDMKGGKITLQGDLEGTGVFNMSGGEVFINGDVASNLGCDVRNGYLEVGGKVDGNLGPVMSGGEIVVEEDVEGIVGEGLEGGKIRVEGDAQAVCANTNEGRQPPATGGEIRIEGEIEELAEENLQGVEVYQKQGNEWREVSL